MKRQVGIQKNRVEQLINHQARLSSGVILAKQQSQSSHLSILLSPLVSTLVKNCSKFFWTILLFICFWPLSSSRIQALSYPRSRTLLRSLSCCEKMFSTKFLQQLSILLLCNLSILLRIYDLSKSNLHYQQGIPYLSRFFLPTPLAGLATSVDLLLSQKLILKALNVPPTQLLDL